MSDEIRQKRSKWERLKDPYRLVIRNEETFEEIASYKLSLMSVYVMLSMLIVLVATVVVLTIAFTPVKRLIPGYAEGINYEELMALQNDLDSIEMLNRAREVFDQNIKRMLVGEVQYAPSELPAKKNSKDYPQVEKISEDTKIRMEVEQGGNNPITTNAPTNGMLVNISPREIPLEQMYFTPPLSGTIVAGFDPEKKHFGVDVVAPKNTPVKAVMDGWVITSDWTLETGNTIAIQHTNNIVTFYKHNSALLKKTGNYVRAGEAIAVIGNTGELTDGPHLHFELWHRGKPVNPTDFVSFK